MDNKVDQFTRGFFWCGYGVFLLASIPHIAAYFRHFDPSASGAEDLFWWVIAYALAVVIDLSDVLISIAVMRAMARGESFKQLWSFWAFIVFIMALSWFFNWQYNVVNQTVSFASVDRVLLFNWITVGTLNPIIGSAFQVLLLVYTAMAHKFAHKPVEKTAAELQAEADEMLAKDVQLARIEALKTTQKQRRRGAFFEEIKQAKEGALQVVKGEAAATVDVAQREPMTEVGRGDPEGDLESDLEGVTEPVILEKLGVIEEAMLRRLEDHPQVRKELLSLAQTTDIVALTTYLQTRFASHAAWITMERVQRILSVLRGNEKQQHMNQFVDAHEPWEGSLDGSKMNAAMEAPMEVRMEVPTEVQEDVPGSLDGSTMNADTPITGSSEGNTMNAAMDISGTIRGAHDGNEMDAQAEEKGSSDEPEMNTLAEDSGSLGEPTTNPEVEAIMVSVFAEQGSSQEVSQLLTRRKPLTVAEAATVLSVSEKTVRSLRKNGKLASTSQGLISVASVRKALEARRSA